MTSAARPEPPNPAALDQLRSALANVDTQVHRAIEAANCCDLVGVREEVERLTPPLVAAGRIIRQLDRANSHTFFTLPAVMSTLPSGDIHSLQVPE